MEDASDFREPFQGLAEVEIAWFRALELMCEFSDHLPIFCSAIQIKLFFHLGHICRLCTLGTRDRPWLGVDTSTPDGLMSIGRT